MSMPSVFAVLVAGAAATPSVEARPATASVHGKMDQVGQLLRNLGLEQLKVAFDEAGYDDTEFLLQLSTEDAGGVAQVVGMKPGHAHAFHVTRLKSNDLMRAAGRA